LKLGNDWNLVVIGPKTAFVLYAVLVGVALLRLHGLALSLALVIVLGLAAKTMVDYFRRRMDQ
jgi:hypothetical protein